MITNELIEKINYLARKKRTEGLTDEELAEQKKVREIYLEGIRQQVRGQLEGLKHTSQHSCECDCCKQNK